ncbi:hypothetical protein MBLNU457_g0595t1 [Dothideomycetes sp. NU457]
MIRHDSVTGEIEVIKDALPPQSSTGLFDLPVEVCRRSSTGLFDLPAEIRTNIYELVFDPEETYHEAFHKTRTNSSPIEINHDYKASTHLEPLLTCKQFNHDANLLALSRTLFVMSNPFTSQNIGSRLQERLKPDQIASLRHFAFVADSRHFWQLRHWKNCAFGQPLLNLTELSIILHRSSYWHYLFDFNNAICQLLRNLQGVQRLTFIQNKSRVKGTLFTWYNRLVRLMLKTDHLERFEREEACPEKSWWTWNHCAVQQTVSFTVAQAKSQTLTLIDYQLLMAPVHEALRLNIESEEYDPDPMSRVSTGL